VKTGERYLVTLDALVDDVPAAVRLRRLLKCALRSFGFRCVSVRDVPADADARVHIVSRRPALPNDHLVE
jgi:hypothetical protein